MLKISLLRRKEVVEVNPREPVLFHANRAAYTAMGCQGLPGKRQPFTPLEGD